MLSNDPMVNITRARPQLSPTKSVTLKTESIGTRFWNPLAESIPTSHRWISESLYSLRSKFAGEADHTGSLCCLLCHSPFPFQFPLVVD